MESNKVYKISLLKNVRFIIFLSLLIVFFIINLSLYQVFTIQDSDYRFIFVIGSMLLITVICYSIFKIQSVKDLQITLSEDAIEYKRNKYETEIINYKDIKGIGFFKKNIEDENHFTFFDGLYIYDGSTDKYCFVGISFNDYREIYQIIRQQCEKAKINWHNIERGKKSLVDELRDLYVS